MNDYLLFDLDGTLTDPKEGITTCVQYALSAFGIEEPDLEKLTPFIGPPLKESFMEFYEFDEEKAEAAVEKYRERFAETGIFENRIYDDIPQLIRKLKGNHKKLAVASSKPTVFVERILEHFEIRKFFDVVVGSELDGSRTDKEEVIAEALRQLYGEDADDIEQKKKNTVMIGDRKYDVTGAKAEGVMSVAVSYGYGPLDELKIAKPDYIVRSVAELEKVLLRGTEKKTVKEPPMTKIWFILFPALIFYFVREMGIYVGSFLVVFLAGSLPAEWGEKLIFLDETGRLVATGNGTAFMSGISVLIAGIVVWKFFAKADIGKAQKELVLKHSRLKKPVAYVAMALGMLGLTLGINYLYDMLGIMEISDAYTRAAQQQYAAALPVGIIVVGLLSPLVEELIFRGVLYNRLRTFMKGGSAILVSALCFGVYHQNIVQGTYAFFMGCAIAFFYERFGHFYIPVIAHVISNVTVYLLTVTGIFDSLRINWWVCIGLLLIGLGGVVFCYGMERPKEPPKEQKEM